MPLQETIITNARLVTPDRVLEGTLRIAHGLITDVDEHSTQVRSAEDWKGDLLLPGLVELHTDNLEKHLSPRPGVRWPMQAALIDHDAQIATAGITTVLDAIAVGYPDDEGLRATYLRDAVTQIENATDRGLLRAEHLLHLRCEVASGTVLRDFTPFAAHPLLRLVSMMDHTPGQRQWTNMDKCREYYQGKHHWNDEKMAFMVGHWKELQTRYSEDNRRVVSALAREKHRPLASHDDTTLDNVRQALDEGATLSEFPTTLNAAAAAREQGMVTIMGGPNLVRGNSHSGNVSALELAKEHMVDILSSDYLPASLLQGAFRLEREAGFTLPQAIATVSSTPARAVGLQDRGAIATGLRADLVRVDDRHGLPLVVSAFRAGQRIA